VYHGNGHLEKVYENALAHRLRKAGLDVKQQHPMSVYDEDGTVVGEYFGDLLVDNQLIAELKSARTIADEHISQTLGYLKASRIEHGLLINFGSSLPSSEVRVQPRTVDGAGYRQAGESFVSYLCVLCVLSRLIVKLVISGGRFCAWRLDRRV
jgi:GxxExxY protein